MNHGLLYISVLIVVAVMLPAIATLASKAVPVLSGILLLLVVAKLAWPVPR